MKILVTGAAGFIGSGLSFRLAEAGYPVIGIDNLNDSYDTRLKLARLERCGIQTDNKRFIDGSTRISGVFPNFRFTRMDISDRGQITQMFREEQFDTVINLAGQSGFSDSISNPYAFMDSNLAGFMNILENCRQIGVKHLIYASSSSVYGTGNGALRDEQFRTDCPMSLNAATKKADELMAYSYSQLYGLRTTGLRFFTVYGPWSRPDTVSMIFANDIANGRPCTVFGNENTGRDFIHIDDAVKAIICILEHNASTANKDIPFSIFNAGSGACTRLKDFIDILAHGLGREAVIRYQPARRGHITDACADMSKMRLEYGFVPSVTLTDGIPGLIDWFTSTL